MKKRLTAGALAALMAASLPITACAAENSAPQPALNTAEHMQYMNGYTDGTFRPDASITRAEASKLLASLLVAIVGIGEATGVLTIAIFTFGMASQLIFESIETIDLSPVEAATAVGANKLKVAVWAIWPQITSSVVSYTFYAFELNVRASTVLGYVGAGGIGVKLNEALGLFKYERVSIIILFIFAVVVLVDALSEAIRRRLK